MHQLPERHSLVFKVAAILRDGIADGTWSGIFPRERDLCVALQVSRSTLRDALSVLREEGMIETVHGVGTRVVRHAAGRAHHIRSNTVGLLLPFAIDRSRFFVTLIIDYLRALLIQGGYALAVHHHPQVELSTPVNLVEKLVRQHRHCCWVLLGCGEGTLSWFSNHKVPAVVSGTCDPALNLPNVCLDNRALGRHAGATLLRYGHRRIALLVRPGNPGLRMGLQDVFGPCRDESLSVTWHEVEDRAESVGRAVDRLLRLPAPPTAVFVAESAAYLSAFSRLAQRGLQVPDDISLMCRDDEPFLDAMIPAPARYAKNPSNYAKRLYGFVVKQATGEPVRMREVLIMPRFVAGGSLRRHGAR